MRRISFFIVIIVLFYCSEIFAIDTPKNLTIKTPFGDFEKQIIHLEP